MQTTLLVDMHEQVGGYDMRIRDRRLTTEGSGWLRSHVADVQFL